MLQDARFTAHVFVAAVYTVFIVISLLVQEVDERAANVLRSNLSWTALMAVNVIWLAYHYALLPAGICLLISVLWLFKVYVFEINGAYAIIPRSNVFLILNWQMVVVNVHLVLIFDEVKRLYGE